VVVVADVRSKEIMAAPGGDLEQLVKAGHLVLAIQLRGLAESPQAQRAASILGDSQLAMRAMVVGKNIVGMRAEDIIHAVDFLAAQPDVDKRRIAAMGYGLAGPPVLHAAVIDERIRRIVLQDSLASYRTAVDRPIHRGLYDVAIPGVLRKYDVADLLTALKPREVVLINPVDALGRPEAVAGFRSLQRGRRDSLLQFLAAP